MTVRISRSIHDAVLALAAADPLREVCGLLFGTSDCIDAMRATANVASDPARHFEIDPAALLAAEREARQGGSQIAGYFHSHPNGLACPSATDIAMANGDGRIWLIVTHEITAWRAVGSGFAPLPCEVGDQLALRPLLRQRGFGDQGNISHDD